MSNQHPEKCVHIDICLPIKTAAKTHANSERCTSSHSVFANLGTLMCERRKLCMRLIDVCVYVPLGIGHAWLLLLSLHLAISCCADTSIICVTFSLP